MLPPLRERAADIPALAEHFVRQFAEQNNWKLKKFSEEATERLKQYPWPGNVRELRNVIERALLLVSGDTVDSETVDRALPRDSQVRIAGSQDTGSASQAAPANGSLASRVEVFERETLLLELKRHHHHMTNTAKALGLERSHLYKKCQQLGIDLRAIRSEN